MDVILALIRKIVVCATLVSILTIMTFKPINKTVNNAPKVFPAVSSVFRVPTVKSVTGNTGS